MMGRVRALAVFSVVSSVSGAQALVQGGMLNRDEPASLYSTTVSVRQE
jgi:hypothetical protein